MKKLNKNALLCLTLTAAMVLGSSPITALAVTGDNVAKDGTYTGTATVEKYNYKVNVTLNVSDGKITFISAIPDSAADEDDQDYLDEAIVGINKAYTGKTATYNEAAKIDAVSGATYSSKAIRSAAAAALASAPAAAASSSTSQTSQTPSQVTPNQNSAAEPARKEYTITFKAKGGKVSPAKMTTKNGKLTSLPKPTRKGYKFKGWYTSAKKGKKVTLKKVYKSNTKLYAQWKKTSKKKK